MKKSRKKIKLYVRHDVAHELNAVVNRPRRFGKLFSALYEVCYACGSIVIEACYLAGLLLVYAFVREKRPAARLEPKIVKTRATLAMRLRRLRHPYVKFGLIIFLGLAVSQAALFKSANLIAYGIDLKGRVLGAATQGVSHLSGAQERLQEQDIAQAQDEFSRAIQSFQQSQNDIRIAGDTLDQLLKVLPQKRDADRLLAAAQHSAQAGLDLTGFYVEMGKIRLTPEGMTGENVAGNFDNMEKFLSQGRENLHKASELIGKVDENNIPGDNRLKVVQAKQLLSNASAALDSFAGIFGVSRDILMGEKHILIIFQNNNELRPTGGFIGTYGSFLVSNGRIKSSKISSVYELDGQLTEKIAAPFPLRQVSKLWYMRDANWFTSFPESARKVASFYEKEGGETPDMVIGMTPSLISDLLTITGPIDLPAYQATLNGENFVQQTQLITSVNYDRNLNKPKQMLADFFPAFLQRLGTLSSLQNVDFFQALQKNLLAKHIMFYSRDRELQQRFRTYNWTGEIRQADRDYLLVSTANLGATKTDLHVRQDIKLEANISEQGDILNTLTITRSNQLPEGEENNNRSFMRIYVPEGSALMSGSGFSPLPDAPGPVSGLRSDPEALAWEASAVKDVLSDTVIGRESGKTFFGNWVSVKGGETKTITVKYKLPFKIRSVDRYSLLLQKQPGSVKQFFDYSVFFPARGLDWQNFTPSASQASNFNLSLNLEKDFFLGSVLSLR